MEGRNRTTAEPVQTPHGVTDKPPELATQSKIRHHYKERLQRTAVGKLCDDVDILCGSEGEQNNIQEYTLISEYKHKDMTLMLNNS